MKEKETKKKKKITATTTKGEREKNDNDKNNIEKPKGRTSGNEDKKMKEENMWSTKEEETDKTASGGSISSLYVMPGLLPMGTQLLSSRTNATSASAMHKHKMVKAAGEENSSRPVAFPKELSLMFGKNVAEAEKKK